MQPDAEGWEWGGERGEKGVAKSGFVGRGEWGRGKVPVATDEMFEIDCGREG